MPSGCRWGSCRRTLGDSCAALAGSPTDGRSAVGRACVDRWWQDTWSAVSGPALRLGMVGSDASLLAHTWVEIDGRPLERVDGYRVFQRLPSRIAT